MVTVAVVPSRSSSAPALPEDAAGLGCSLLLVGGMGQVYCHGTEHSSHAWACLGCGQTRRCLQLHAGTACGRGPSPGVPADMWHRQARLQGLVAGAWEDSSSQRTEAHGARLGRGLELQTPPSALGVCELWWPTLVPGERSVALPSRLNYHWAAAVAMVFEIVTLLLFPQVVNK